MLKFKEHGSIRAMSGQLAVKETALRVEAYISGCLLPEEIDPELIEAALQAKTKQKGAAKSREAKLRLIATRRDGGRLPEKKDLVGKFLFLDSTLNDKDQKVVENRCRELNLTIVSNRKTAQYYLAENPGDHFSNSTEQRERKANPPPLPPQPACA